jgi:cell division protease FtsH
MCGTLGRHTSVQTADGASHRRHQGRSIDPPGSCGRLARRGASGETDALSGEPKGRSMEPTKQPQGPVAPSGANRSGGTQTTTSRGGATTSLTELATAGVIDGADVARGHERARQRRLFVLALLLALLAIWLGIRDLIWHRGPLSLPQLTPGELHYLPAILLIALLGAVMAVSVVGVGRSPHVLFRPGELDVRFEDVKGAGPVVDEVRRTLNLFLAHRTFAERMGGTPRRGVLFEGPPGTGKTYLAKALAAEAQVPFLFVSSSAFQSMYYGATNRKIRSYFRALRRHARREGGAIGFIEEIDAIGAARAVNGIGHREGIAGVVNELLIQLQSFEAPSLWVRLHGIAIDFVNQWLPRHYQLHKRPIAPANILVIGATNRASDLDPALLRPGRFDRSIYFDLPTRAGRREIIDYYLQKKAHSVELDDPARRDALAGMTQGYSPVMIEHLLDEALVSAVRRGDSEFTWSDLTMAKMANEIGLAHGTVYTEAERRMIATHEAGHAAIAWLVGRGRSLDVLSIVKRRDMLGLLAHSDAEERFTRTKSEMRALIQIAMGGMAAEELYFGESSSGVGGDLISATKTACQMIGALGMGSSLIADASPGLTGTTDPAVKILEHRTGRDEVDRLLARCKAEADSMLRQHRHIVEALRDALLERDELVGGEIESVIASASRTVLPQTVTEDTLPSTSHSR